MQLQMCAMQVMWLNNATNFSPAASNVDFSLKVIKSFEQALSVIIPSKRQSVSSQNDQARLSTANVSLLWNVYL